MRICSNVYNDTIHLKLSGFFALFKHVVKIYNHHMYSQIIIRYINYKIHELQIMFFEMHFLREHLCFEGAILMFEMYF